MFSNIRKVWALGFFVGDVIMEVGLAILAEVIRPWAPTQ